MLLLFLKDQFGVLIVVFFVSCIQFELDQINCLVVDLLVFWLGDLGFCCEIWEVLLGKFNLLVSYGSGFGGLVLVGYIDIVFYDEVLWSSDLLCLDECDGCWYGFGSCDMKGFFLLVIEVLLLLFDQLFCQLLMIFVICDEESLMVGVCVFVESGWLLGCVMVIGELINLWLICLYKGVMMECIEIFGQSGYLFDLNFGCSVLEVMYVIIGELMVLCGEWQQVWNNLQFSVFQLILNFGCIYGGDNFNCICGQCLLEFDLCLLFGMQFEQLCEVICQCLWLLVEWYKVSIDYQLLFFVVLLFEQVQDSELVCVVECLIGYCVEVVVFGIEVLYFQCLGSEILVFGVGDIVCVYQFDEYFELVCIELMVGVLCWLIQYYCLMFVVD